jgi:energy-converting hydrogenase Eha subunit C
VPFIAVCPYCQTGRVRAPDTAVGMTAPCPRCHTSFTLVASGETLEQARERTGEQPRVEVTSSPTVTTRQSPLDTARPTYAVKPSAPTAVVEATPLAAAAIPGLVTPYVHVDDDRELADAESDPLRAPTLIAFILAGVALVLSQVPYGKFGTIGLAAIGLLVALACCFGARTIVLPAAAAGLNAVVVLLVFLLPTWLGIKSWRPDPVIADLKTVKAFSPDGLQPALSEWMDPSQAWQFDDVRVRLIASVGPIELTGAKSKKQWTKKQYLQLRVTVANVGVARQIAFAGWGGQTPAKITDATGKVVPPATFETGWDPLIQPKAASLAPGQTAEQTMLFELPPDPGEFFRLELPGTVCGAAEQVVRFQIPARRLGYRPPG